MDRGDTLVRVKLPPGSGKALAALADAHGAFDTFEALHGGEICVYVRPSGDAQGFVATLRAALPDADFACLASIMTVAGASDGADAPFHYVVETDVTPEAEDDFNAWYDREHLAGLAAVPGCVRASRYRNLGAGPRYFACYDLATPEAFGSPAWLAVRATRWSDRVRPSFRNTQRTMYRRALPRSVPTTARPPTS